MKVVATTSREMLEVALCHLHGTGWPIVDISRLADAYLEFRHQVRRCVYGVASGPSLRDHLRSALCQDIDALVTKSFAARTVSRVRPTPKGLSEAALLKLEQATYGSLLDVISKSFPPKA